MRPGSLYDLVERLYRIVCLQYIGVRKALHGQGNFQLSAENRRFLVPDTTCRQKTEDEKEKHFKKLLYTKSCSKEKVIISSDGLLSLPPARKLARKPVTLSRIRTTRTI